MSTKASNQPDVSPCKKSRISFHNSTANCVCCDPEFLISPLWRRVRSYGHFIELSIKGQCDDAPKRQRIHSCTLKDSRKTELTFTPLTRNTHQTFPNDVIVKRKENERKIDSLGIKSANYWAMDSLDDITALPPFPKMPRRQKRAERWYVLLQGVSGFV